MIRIGEVIAIIDAQSSNAADPYFSFLDIANKKGRFEQISSDEIKAYVITDQKIYGSPISSLTLLKRAEQSQYDRK
ncbi:protein of unknown function [Thermoflavimicrobium dichotomicum]|uniref:DUF370 domain-containing protein n=2 Tax=Thermoflavimicrobium dichotomicum TaxID=46223 RepID=A0A1I3KEM1_9BACL|nr:protein of unknown function [Thermoflavimicrobium dichotomicum]